MPAKSKAQQAFLAICEHSPQHARGTCPDMTRQQLHDFAATPTRGLPEHVGKAVRRRQSSRSLRGR